MRVARITATLASILRVYAFTFLLVGLASLYWDPPETPTFGLSEDWGLPMKTTTVGFLLCFVFVLLLSFLLGALISPSDETLREREAYFIIGFGWILCALLGALPFILAGATRSVSVASFESMSALTTTGFSALPTPLEQYAPSVHIWRGTLHFFGGLGIVTMLVAIVGRLTAGGVRLFASESAGEFVRIRPRFSDTARSLFVVYLTVNFLTFVALWFALRYTGPSLDWKTAAYEAYVHAVGSIATGGMGTRSDSILAFNSVLVNWIIAAAMLVGSISFIFFFQAATGGGLRAFRESSVLRFYLTFLAVSSLAVSAFLYMDGHSAPKSLGVGVFMAITSTATCGYTVLDPNVFPDGAKLILVLLMVTGGMVGSTAGAVKVDRIHVLFRLSYNEIRTLLHPHAVSVLKNRGRIVPPEAVRRVIVFFFAYVTLFIGGALAFGVLGFDFDSSIVASAASLGGVGYGWGMVTTGFQDPVTEVARIVGMLLMWLGRLEIFAGLLLFTPMLYKD